jgi:hypothetical protein
MYEGRGIPYGAARHDRTASAAERRERRRNTVRWINPEPEMQSPHGTLSAERDWRRKREAYARAKSALQEEADRALYEFARQLIAESARGRRR